MAKNVVASQRGSIKKDWNAHENGYLYRLNNVAILVRETRDIKDVFESLSVVGNPVTGVLRGGGVHSLMAILFRIMEDYHIEYSVLLKHPVKLV